MFVYTSGKQQQSGLELGSVENFPDHGKLRKTNFFSTYISCQMCVAIENDDEAIKNQNLWLDNF